MNKRDSFILYTSFYKPISKLSDKQLGRLFRAIFAYNLGEVVNVEEDISMAFGFFENQFELDEQKRQDKIMRDIENGRKGGNPNFKKGQPNPYKQRITDNNPGLLQITGHKANENDNVNENDNESENDIPPLIPLGGQRVGYEFFGTFKNVELKPAELRKLQMDFGESETQSAIDDLSCKLMDGTQQSNVHYATLTYWLASRRKKQQQNPQRQKSKSEKLEDSFEKTKQMLGL